jgi:hypothetical protein
MIRIRVCLQAYRKCCVFSSAFRRCVGASEFFSTLFSPSTLTSTALITVEERRFSAA